MAKVAIITGASRGIGAATALRLASDGFDACVNYLSKQSAANQVVEKARSFGVNALAVQADISSERDVVRLFDETANILGEPTALVNNAGILFSQCRVSELSAERINKVLTTNVTGYFLCCIQAIKCMSTNNSGSGGVIVNVSSMASRYGSAGV